jgi:hypothetical protein
VLAIQTKRRYACLVCAPSQHLVPPLNTAPISASSTTSEKYVSEGLHGAVNLELESTP